LNALAELDSLLRLFPHEPSQIAKAEHIAAELAPEPYHTLLVHAHHMTVTMEAYHQTSVDVRVLNRHTTGDTYCREIILLKHGTSQVVQYGIVRLNLNSISPQVRQEILAEQTPLGRVLIQHDVLRQIELAAILRLECGPHLSSLFQVANKTITYGRLATIFCDGQPAIDLLEVSTPLPGQYRVNQGPIK